MSTFADRIQSNIEKTGSHLVAGFDPVLDKFPNFILADSDKLATSDNDYIERALSVLSDLFLSAVKGRIAAIKPNIAFFEQYGVAGIISFARFCKSVKEAGIPLITDAKRGDIGSTATAYSAAFLGEAVGRGGRKVDGFSADALTVNPFLGFDTLEPFIKDCQKHGRGIFVLTQTSNPGAAAIQGLIADGKPVREHIAQWLSDRAEDLIGECGWSGLGAVVGASYPEEARKLRGIMPRNLFLIPGLGAQGAAASDSVAGFGSIKGTKGGALINVSRGLLEGTANNADELVALISNNVARYNNQIRAALG